MFHKGGFHVACHIVSKGGILAAHVMLMQSLFK